jgi:hypothetical protein
MSYSIKSINENLIQEDYPKIYTVFGRHNGGAYSYTNSWNPEAVNLIYEKQPKVLTVDGLTSTSNIELINSQVGLTSNDIANFGTHVLFGDSYALPSLFPLEQNVDAMNDLIYESKNLNRIADVSSLAIAAGLISVICSPQMNRRTFLKGASAFALSALAIPKVIDFVDGNNFSSSSNLHNWILQLDNWEGVLFSKLNWFAVGRHAIMYLKTQDYIKKMDIDSSDSALLMGFRHANDQALIENSQSYTIQAAKNYVDGCTLLAEKYLAENINDINLDLREEIISEIKTYKLATIIEDNKGKKVYGSKKYVCDVLDKVLV